MERKESWLVAFNLIGAAAICNWVIIFYAIPQLDWFLILWPFVPVILIMVGISYMPKGNASEGIKSKDNIVSESNETDALNLSPDAQQDLDDNFMTVYG